tara:strand:- start:131 stop:664 length:534 start_codon:yes stop_codon:yes gene_type:complete
MLKYNNLHKALEKFRDLVIEEAKSNLVSDGKDPSGSLYQSIEGNPVKTYPNSLEFSIDMASYATFVDKGVSGTRKKYNTPYAYSGRFKMIPPSKLDKWIIKKGIAPRDKDGKFMTRKSLQYAIATSVYRNGLKPSLFFTKPFEKYFKNIPTEIIDSFGLDVKEFMSFIVKQNIADLK